MNKNKFYNWSKGFFYYKNKNYMESINEFNEYLKNEKNSEIEVLIEILNEGLI